MKVTANGWTWDPTEDGGAGAWTKQIGPHTWTIVKDSDINSPPPAMPGKPKPPATPNWPALSEEE